MRCMDINSPFYGPACLGQDDYEFPGKKMPFSASRHPEPLPGHIDLGGDSILLNLDFFISDILQITPHTVLADRRDCVG